MRQTFQQFVQQRENYGGSPADPSGVDDQGDGGDGVEKRMEKPGAFPTYTLDGSDLPITRKNRSNFMKKCNCQKKK
jgi:hypothetical protein